MSKITPLMTSLHEGHKAEERLKCIDDMLDKCIDTKFTVLQAFWWYRKYTKAKLDKLEQIEQIIADYGITLEIINHADDGDFSDFEIDIVREVLENG